MSHPKFSQLPAFSFQRKLPTNEPRNVGGGEDGRSNPSCQPHVWLFAVEAVSLTIWSRMSPLAAGCQRKTGGLGAGGLVQLVFLPRPQFPPCPSKEAGLNDMKAHLVSSPPDVLQVRWEPQGSPWLYPWCSDHASVFPGLIVSSTDCETAPIPGRGFPCRRRGATLGENPSPL